MARLWSFGAELQSATDGVEVGTVYGATVDTTIKHSGAASFECSGTIAASDSVGFDHSSFGNSAVLFARWYIYIDSLTDGGSVSAYMDLYSGTTNVISISVTRSGSTYTATPFYNNFGGSLSTFTVTPDTWHYIEVEYDTSAANGSEVFKVRQDGVEEVASAAMNFTTKTVNIISSGVFNGTAGNVTDAIVYFDDIAVNNNSGSYENTYPGAGSIVHMQPNAAGDANDCLSGDYSSVDEVTPDDATTVAVFDANEDILDVNLETSANAGIGASDTINFVAVGYRAAGINANSRAGVLRIKGQASGTTTESATLTVLSASYDTNAPSTFIYKLTAYVNPQDSAAWETTDLDQMQIGYRATDAAPDINVTTLWALVEYVPAAAGTVVKDMMGGFIPFAR